MQAPRRFISCLPRFSLILILILLVKFTVIGIFFFHREAEEHQHFLHFARSHFDLNEIGVKKYLFEKNYERKDWHDYEFIEYEKSRSGVGEQGKGWTPTDPSEIDLFNKIKSEEGFGALASDKISVQRSVPDTRPESCKRLKYFKNLPQTSVIVIFHNEWLSVLLRTVHSIYNRSPKELLKEIILVNDNSTKEELNDELELYVKENFDDRVKILHLRERKGLIVTRMEGAKLATGEVLIFLDSHIEVNVNWLPPLLEPIAMSPTTVTTPLIDDMVGETMEYTRGGPVRGVFDEIMWYQWFPIRPQDKIFDWKPYQVPVMLGCAFAIRRDFFNDLGQYDEGLMIWNGEQIELSLKLHLCGGDLMEVPCSRASHFFRGHKHHGLPGVDVAARNFKRLGEVWMGEFKNVMYEADPKRFGPAETGDLTKALMVYEKLNCKPFRYFLENISPEMYTSYYYVRDYPGAFAWGLIKSEAFPDLCIDFMDVYFKPVKLNKCSNEDPDKISWTQNFKLTWHRKIRLHKKDDCLKDNTVLDSCRYGKDDNNQDWKYDPNTKQFVQLSQDMKCLTATLDEPNLFLSPCNLTDTRQKWNWQHLNSSALERFDEIYYRDGLFIGLD